MVWPRSQEADNDTREGGNHISRGEEMQAAEDVR